MSAQEPLITFRRTGGTRTVEQTNDPLFQRFLVCDGFPVQHLLRPGLALDQVSPAPVHVLQDPVTAHTVEDQHPVQRHATLFSGLDGDIFAVRTGHYQSTLALLDLSGQLEVCETRTCSGIDTLDRDDSEEDGGEENLPGRYADDDIFTGPLCADPVGISEVVSYSLRVVARLGLGDAVSRQGSFGVEDRRICRP